ncbi:Dyp-type peroxidase domain-containing protein [Actinopolymorpha pittospori]|uniref:Dyp-type peroxidase domain-containing protein n=1 Tax=Actinopolymorpha pittospori TaxID=648752 RepID=UPI003375FC90
MTGPRTPAPSDRVSRRGFIGAAVAGSAGAVAAVTALTTNPAAADGGVPVTPPAAYPFQGKHQSGILELAQRASAFVAFTVTSPDRARLQQMLKTLTSTIRHLMTGRGVPYDGMVSTSYENGVLGPDIAPDGLTVTVSVGSSLFDDRFGLKSAKPVTSPHGRTSDSRTRMTGPSTTRGCCGARSTTAPGPTPTASSTWG